MKITYIIANYNNGKYLRDCLDSLLSQTNPNWMAIIFDDASIDNSLDVIQPYLSDKISLIKSDKNIGPAGARNKLISVVKTDIVGQLDSDDALIPNATEIVIKTYEENSHIGFTYSRYVILDQEFKTILKTSQARPIPLGKTSLQAGQITHLRTFRRELFGKIAPVDAERFRKGANDADLFLKIEEVAKPMFIDEVLYKYRMNPNSISNTTRLQADINNLYAKIDALRRREIGFSFQFFVYLQFFICDFIFRRRGYTWVVVKEFFKIYYAFLKFFDTQFCIRNPGKLRRS